MRKLINLFLVLCCAFNVITYTQVKAETTSTNNQLLEKYFKGKQFSILGDSISTYVGYSNDAINTNSTIGSNALWFKDQSVITSVNETWWMQVANQAGMNVLVNNSWSGSEMAGNGYVRASQLHDNTGSNAGTKPDIVAIFMGVNDVNHFEASKLGEFNEEIWNRCYTLNEDGTYTYITPTTFAQSYAIAIHKIKTLYRSEVFCCTMMENGISITKDKEELLQSYRKTLMDIAEYFDCHIVDFYSDAGINPDTFATYTTDNLHPNEQGMDLMSTNFVNEMIEYAKEQENLDHRAQLFALISETQRINQQVYTEDSLNNLLIVSLQAQNVYSNQNASDEEVLDAIYKLNVALKNLERPLFPGLDEKTLINTNEKKDCVKVVTYSSQSSTDAATNALDYNEATIWHTDWNNANNKVLPHYITFDLQKDYTISDILFLPRQTGNNGDIFKLNVYISDSIDINSQDLVGTYEFENNTTAYLDRGWKRIELEQPIKGRYVKLESINTGGNGGVNQFTSMAEVRFYGNEYVEVNKEELKTLIDKAKAIDTTNKTDESVSKLIGAITIAENVYANANVTQDEVNAAKTALEEAMNQLEEVKPKIPFVDVEKSKWYYNVIQAAYDKGLMQATGLADPNHPELKFFEPDTPISRAMVATVLYRMANKPSIEFKATFSDVTNPKLWYSTAITWASANGVVSGYKDGCFGPDDHITRQDLAIMLRNYAKACGLDTNVKVDFTTFADGNKVASYAQSAIAFCTNAKLMSGAKQSDGSVKLNPTDKATRAECAKMFSLLDDLIKE